MIIESRPSCNVAPLVSVALCTFRPGQFLIEQLASIANQSRRPDEIVVTDDTPDESSSAFIIENLRKTGIPFYYEHNANTLGVAANFEKALLLCRGEFVFLSDQDDVWFASKVARLLAYMQANPRMMLAFSGGILTDEGLQSVGTLASALGLGPRERHQLYAGNAFEILLARNYCTGAATVIRRILLEKTRPFPVEKMYHDDWLGACAAAAGRIGYLDESLFYYRQHTSNVIGAQAGWRGYVQSAHARVRQHAAYHRLNCARSEGLVMAAERAQAFAEPDARALSLARRKMVFARFRAGLPGNLLRRLLAVGGNVGGYYYFALGTSSLLADLLLGGDPASDTER